MYSELVPKLARFDRPYGVTLAFALLGIASVYAPGWKDPSKHTERFIETEPGVKLEVLDWGGTGQPVLLR